MVKKLHKMASMLLFAMVLTVAGTTHAASLLTRVQHAVKTAFKKHPAVATQLRTVAYSQPPKIALQRMRGITATRSLTSLSKPASFLQRTEANQGFIRTFIAPLLVGTRSQRTITTDAATNKAVRTEEGPVAKVKLLQGHLTGMPPHMNHATLLHGAMLWELGIIKSLYTLLITPKIEFLENGQQRLVPDTSFKPLGTLLQQLFYLAGGTFAPTKRQSVYANKLKPAALGSLYKAIIDNSITADFDPRVKKISNGKAKKEEYETTRSLFMETLIACKTPNPLNPPDLSATIMMSFFWAKFVMGAETTAQAQENLIAFFQAAIGQDGPKMSAPADEIKIEFEANAIQRIIDAYNYSLPKPPIQGRVTLATGHSFPDCGESGIRGFFNAAFYDASTKQFAIPTTQENFYDPRLVVFYTAYPTLAAQSSQEARNAWGEVISNRTDLTYNNDGICDLGCAFTNVMYLMAQLAPGIYQKLSSNCTCGDACSWKTTMPTDPAFSAQIKAHFIASPICTQAMLKQITKHHSLSLENFKIDTKTDAASWQMFHESTKLCHLSYRTHNGHMSCDLHTKPLAQQQILDPVLGAADAVSAELRAPDYIEPLLFAAARMAQQQNFADAYFSLLHVGQDNLAQIQKNIRTWGLMTPESERLVAKYSASPNKKLSATMQLGLARTATLLLEYDNASLNINSEEGKKAFKDSVEKGHTDIVKIFIDRGVDINARLVFEDTPLMTAIEHGYVDLVKLLLEHGADIHIQKYGEPAIYWAMQADRPDLIKALLDHGVDIKTKDEYRGTLLMQAATKGHLELVKFLLARGADIEAKGRHDETAFMRAAENGHIHILQLLFDHGANINAKGLVGRTTLMYATQAKNNTIEALSFLLDRGANINETTRNGETAFMLAATEGAANAIKFLLERGASFDNKEGILLCAAEGGNVELITLLLKEGASINAKNIWDETVLHCAAKKNNADALKLLLRHGANIEARTKYGSRTPLMTAVNYNNKNTVAVLLEHGADITTRDSDNKTALMLAEEGTYRTEVAALLRQHIANKNTAATSSQRAKPIQNSQPVTDGAEEVHPPVAETPMHVPGFRQRAYTRFMRILFGP